MRFKTGAIRMIAAVIDDMAPPKKSKTARSQIKALKNALLELDQRISAIEQITIIPEQFEKAEPEIGITEYAVNYVKKDNVYYLCQPLTKR